ncbi:MAG: hypothetical protein AB7I24_09565 [Candidatus Nanopelagicales bacterium]
MLGDALGRGGESGSGLVALAVVGVWFATFVGVTFLLLRRARRRPRPGLVPRAWRVAGWMIWATLVLSLRPPDVLEDAVTSWSGAAPVRGDVVLVALPVIAGIVVALILYLGALLDVYAERRALPWAAGYFVLVIAMLVVDAVVPGSDGFTRSALFVVVTSVPPLVGLVAVVTASRTSVPQMAALEG